MWKLSINPIWPRRDSPHLKILSLSVSRHTFLSPYRAIQFLCNRFLTQHETSDMKLRTYQTEERFWINGFRSFSSPDFIKKLKYTTLHLFNSFLHLKGNCPSIVKVIHKINSYMEHLNILWENICTICFTG